MNQVIERAVDMVRCAGKPSAYNNPDQMLRAQFCGAVEGITSCYPTWCDAQSVVARILEVQESFQIAQEMVRKGVAP